MPKKSLDEYYLDFKKAKYLEYDFIGNMNSKIGSLRCYNRKNFCNLINFERKNNVSLDEEM